MQPLRKTTILVAVALLAGGIAPPRARAADDPPEAKQVDAAFADLVKPGSPGCALAVARNGEIVYEKGYGLASVEQEVFITPRTVFDIGSTSKQFTAASILLLEKEGKLSVNDDVHKFIPELPDYGKKITILNLLNHTSGIRDYLTLFELAGVYTDSVTTDEDALAIITRQQSLNFEPGSEFLYSNSGYFLLSVIVKRVGGKSLPEFAAENIFKPLGMTQTLYRDQHTQLVPGRALAYDAKEPGPGFSLNVSYFEQTGDGAVHTSVEDLLKWDENFYTAKVGGRPLLAELQETATLNSGKKLRYAKGLVVSRLPRPSRGRARRLLGRLSRTAPPISRPAFFRRLSLQPWQRQSRIARHKRRGHLPRFAAETKGSRREIGPRKTRERRKLRLCRLSLLRGTPETTSATNSLSPTLCLRKTGSCS